MNIASDQTNSINTLLKVEKVKTSANSSNYCQYKNDSIYFYFSMFAGYQMSASTSKLIRLKRQGSYRDMQSQTYKELEVYLLSSSTGIARGWTSPVFPKLRSIDENPLNYPVETIQLSLIASLMDVGQVVSPYLYVFLLERVGRKKSLLCIGIPFVIGNIILGCTESVYFYYLARILIGAASGGTHTVIPVYISEVAQKHNRGKFIVLEIICLNLGCLYSYSIGPFFTVSTFSFICAILAILFLIAYRFLPESPLYLTIKGQIETARLINGQLRKNLLLVTEHDIMKEDECRSADPSHEENNLTNLNILKSKRFRKTLVIGVLLMIAEPLSGIINVIAYSQQIFLKAGGEKLSQYFSIISGCYLIVLTLIITVFVLEKFKRKSLMLMGTLGTTVSLTLLTTFFFLKEKLPTETYVSWIPLALTISYLTFFQCYGPTAWVVLSEMFPAGKTRALGIGIATSMFLFSICINAFMFPIVADFFGMAEVFLIHNIFSLLAFVFIFFVVPETKNKSPSEIWQGQ